MKTLIFDFDGTLVDSLPVVMEIAEEIAGEHIAVTKQEIDKLRNMPARDVIKYSGIPYWKIPRLLLQGKVLMSKRLKELKVFPGIKEVLKQLNDAGHTICVVSSNSESNIRAVLKKEGIENYFDGVYGNVGLFTKSRVFKVVLRDKKVAAGDAIYVGDEVRDIEAARKGNIPIVSVTWGYNGAKILELYHPNYLVDSPKELLAILHQ